MLALAVCRLRRCAYYPFAHKRCAVVLLLRLYVMYDCNRALLLSLSALLAMQLVAESAIVGPIVAKMKRSSFHASSLPALTHLYTAMALPPSFTGCVPNNPSDHTWAYWIPMLVFETTLCVLAIVKSVQIARAQLYTSKVLSTMLRDTVAYFGGILVIIIANFVIWFAARVSAHILACCGPLTL